MTERADLNVLFIQHEDYVKPGEYLRWTLRRGMRPRFIRCWENTEFPEPRQLPDLLIVLGGPQNPGTTRAECPWFDAAAEMRLIRRCARAGGMVVGACLGAQLMGEAFGGHFSRSPERELGPTPLRLTAAGRTDPLLRAFPSCFIGGESHRDMSGLPEGCVILAESAGCPRQILRYGRYLYGLQTHLEFDPSIEAEILDHTPPGPEDTESRPFVQDRETILAYDCGEMNALLSSFLDALTASWLADRREGEGA